MALAVHSFLKRREHARKLCYQNIKLNSERMQVYRRFRSRIITALIGTIFINCFQPCRERKIWCKVCSENWWNMLLLGQYLHSFLTCYSFGNLEWELRKRIIQRGLASLFKLVRMREAHVYCVHMSLGRAKACLRSVSSAQVASLLHVKLCSMSFY